MRISVIGCGHLGAVHAACLAETGFDVIGLDTDMDKISSLSAGRPPFHEPDLEGVLSRNLASERLRFTTDYTEVAEFADLHFICVGTPQRQADGSADLTYIDAAIHSLAPLLNRPCVVIGKSTVPVGTTATLRKRINELAPAGEGVEIGWSPEFLREGFGVLDTLRPSRIVLGTDSPNVELAMRKVCAQQISEGIPFIATDPATAELAKASANAFLATKISFINAIADLAEVAGADIHQLSAAIGPDPRIGAPGLKAGIGYGGGCLPKDVRALRSTAHAYDVHRLSTILDAVEAVNEYRRRRILESAEQVCGRLADSKIAVLGAAFKPGTDDVRDSPALDIAHRLQIRGAHVTVYDPEAMSNARTTYPGLTYSPSVNAAVYDTEVVLHLTDWPEFANTDPVVLCQEARIPRLIDGRGGLNHARWRAAGWHVTVIGVATPRHAQHQALNPAGAQPEWPLGSEPREA